MKKAQLPRAQIGAGQQLTVMNKALAELARLIAKTAVARELAKDGSSAITHHHTTPENDQAVESAVAEARVPIS